MNKKYRLIFNSFGFQSARKEYAEGEEVRVSFTFVATDTDYSFDIDVDDLKRDYDVKNGYGFIFIMPDHDVTFNVSTRNTMMRDPNIRIPGIDIPERKDEGELKEGEWRCPECGNVNTGKFCCECGSKRPE